MSDSASPIRYSIIIPLEFHRGQVEACLRRWAFEQTYAREQYEIIAAGCRHSLAPEEVRLLKTQLGPQDKLLLFDEPHDIALCAHGAKQAQGKVLLFTESHCFPEQDALASAGKVLDAHPEWAGCSGRSIPITHNRLSEVEAEMYQADIQQGLQEHPWRKILDQFFLVRAEPYADSGGFLPDLGHFAEWHLAARMHQKGFRIGFAPELAFKHYYIGDTRELIEFSSDFARGEMTFQLKHAQDPCRSYFQEPGEWTARFQCISSLSRKALRLAQRTRPKKRRSLLPHRHELAGRTRLVFEWVMRACFGFRADLWRACYRFHAARWGLRMQLWRSAENAALQAAFLRFISATTDLERIRCAQQWHAQFKGEWEKLSAAPPEPVFSWTPGTPLTCCTLGLHPEEAWKGQRLRWSEPVGMLETRLLPGEYRFLLEWCPIYKIRDLTLYLNEVPLPTTLENERASTTVRVESSQLARFAWTYGSWRKTPGERRMLGVPLTRIELMPVN